MLGKAENRDAFFVCMLTIVAQILSSLSQGCHVMIHDYIWTK